MYGVSGQSFCGTSAVESCVLYLKLDSKQIIKDKMEKKKKWQKCKTMVPQEK